MPISDFTIDDFLAIISKVTITEMREMRSLLFLIQDFHAWDFY